MSELVALPSWMGALEPFVNDSLGIPPSIPFTSTEAICNPGLCMPKVTEEQCELLMTPWIPRTRRELTTTAKAGEHDVVEPILRSHYGNGAKFSDAYLQQFTHLDG